MRILLIEDNPGDIYILMQELSRVDFAVEFTSFHTGKQAIDYIRQIENDHALPVPDFVILDPYLPTNSGLEVLAYLTESTQIQLSSVILYTNGLNNEAWQQVYKALPSENIISKSNEAQDDISRITDLILRKMNSLKN